MSSLDFHMHGFCTRLAPKRTGDDAPKRGPQCWIRTNYDFVLLLVAMVDLVGFEPTTYRVRAGCSDSTELQIHVRG